MVILLENESAIFPILLGDLKNHQWLLQYPGVGILLGSDPTISPSSQRGYHHMTAPDIGEVTLLIEDGEGVRADGIRFGQDFRGGRLITFELGLRGNDNDDVLTLQGELLRAWRGDGVRDTPGRVATLCTSSSGRLRQVYGRPRQCSVNHTKPRSAFMLATATFQTVNDLWYDPIVQSVNLPIIPPPSGGFAAPFTTPISTTAATSNFGNVAVSGTARTYPIITINGPIVNPRVALVNKWEIGLNNVSIADGASIIIDARPWVGTVLHSSGGSLAGSLTRTSRIDRIFLDPGLYTLSFTGTDVTGTSDVSMAWNNAYASE